MNRCLTGLGCLRGGLTVLLLLCVGVGAVEPPGNGRVSDEGLVVHDISGKPHTVFALGEDKARLFIFVINDCPIANIYAPEIRRLFKKYARQGVSSYLVYTDPDSTEEAVRVHAKDYGHKGYPVVFDRTHRVVRATGATQTPEAVVVGRGGKIEYRGRIDNRYAALGRPRPKATQHDLRNALDEIIAGKPVSIPRAKTIGCYIPPLSK